MSMSQGGSAAVIFDDLENARRAAGPGEVVAQLAPLSRWIVVDVVDFNAYAATCGWVMDVPATTFLRPRCIDCDGLIEARHPEAKRCGACQVEHEEREIRRAVVAHGLPHNRVPADDPGLLDLGRRAAALPPSASERIARALWNVQDRAFSLVLMTGREG